MKRKRNKKEVYLLLFLTAFSFGAIKILRRIEDDLKAQGRVENIAQDSQSCGSNGASLALNSLNNESNYQVIELPESETVKVSSVGQTVKGITSPVSCSAGFSNMLRLNEAEVCMDGSGDLNYEGGEEKSGEVLVSKDARFELIEVWYPLAFWLGNFEYIDSNKNIVNANTAYRGNGEQIDENYQARNLSPKEANTFRQEISDTVRQNFALEGMVDASPNEGKEQNTGKYVVRNVNDAVCACNPDVAVSDYNVGKSNYIASDKIYGGYWRMQVPKGDNYDNNSDSSCTKEDQIRYEELKDGVVNACTNTLAFIKGFFHEIFAPDMWDGCKNGVCVDTTTVNANGECTERVKTNECIRAEGITVKMPSIFGDPYKCTTDLCANAFLTYLQRASLDPSTAAGKKVKSKNTDESLTFFVATKCKVQVVQTSEIITVKCLWDASPLLANYNLQKKDHAPRSDNEQARSIDYPKTFDAYWKNTDKAITESAKYYKLPSYID